MFPRQLGAVLAAALTVAMIPACGSSNAPYIPNAATAREDLDTALAAWKKGGTASELMKGEHPIYFVDSDWDSGQVLESYQILEEKATTSETEKTYGAVLKMKKPASEKTVEYVAVGRSPMWIFRDVDYVKQGGMGEEPKAKGKRPAGRR